MQNVQDSLQPSCTFTWARLRSIISVMGTSRNFTASLTGDTAMRVTPGLQEETRLTISARSLAPTTTETPSRAASSSGARWA